MYIPQNKQIPNESTKKEIGYGRIGAHIYQRFLGGKFWNESFVNVNYSSVSISLEDFNDILEKLMIEIMSYTKFTSKEIILTLKYQQVFIPI